jgi:hypothetical protein
MMRKLNTASQRAPLLPSRRPERIPLRVDVIAPASLREPNHESDARQQQVALLRRFDFLSARIVVTTAPSMYFKPPSETRERVKC